MKLEKLVYPFVVVLFGSLLFYGARKQYKIIKENIQDYKREEDEREYFERMMFI
mgnify:FL=1